MSCIFCWKKYNDKKTTEKFECDVYDIDFTQFAVIL